MLSEAPSSDREPPAWYSAAKLGIFVHWGLYSIPAFADGPDGSYHAFMADLMGMRDTTGKNPYAEWYLNALRIEGSPTAVHHVATYGTASYCDFREEFERNAARVDFSEWASLFASVGAQYVVMVTRHLDGYPLWPTAVPHPRIEGYHSPRDLIGDLANAVRARGIRMGLYYAGGIDWTLTDRPVRVMTDLMHQQAGSPEYAAYAADQWRELIERYRPSILWNDMGWPGGNDPRDLFADYYAAVPDGIVNDRWTQLELPRNGALRRLYLGFLGLMLRGFARSGRPVPLQAPKIPFDVRTFEYEVPDSPPAGLWEVTRGVGNSFGHSATEAASSQLTGTDLVHLFVDVVARGGRLLLNVGPDGEGRIPEAQRRPLSELARWLATAGPALFGTTPWTTTTATTAEGEPVRFTRSGNTLNVIILSESPGRTVRLPGIALPSSAAARMLGSKEQVRWREIDGDTEISLPVRAFSPAHVVTFEGGARE